MTHINTKLHDLSLKIDELHWEGLAFARDKQHSLDERFKTFMLIPPRKGQEYFFYLRSTEAMKAYAKETGKDIHDLFMYDGEIMHLERYQVVDIEQVIEAVMEHGDWDEVSETVIPKYDPKLVDALKEAAIELGYHLYVYDW